MTNIIELAKNTIVNLLNTNDISRRTTADNVAAVMNESLEEGDKITGKVVKALVGSSVLNTKDVQEFELCKGRYGGIREIDIESRKAAERKAQIAATRRASMAKARLMLQAKREAVVVESGTAEA